MALEIYRIEKTIASSSQSLFQSESKREIFLLW